MSCYTDISLLAHLTRGKDTETIILKSIPDSMIMEEGGLLEFLVDEIRDRIDCLQCELIECCNTEPEPIDYGSQGILTTGDTTEVNSAGPTPVQWDNVVLLDGEDYEHITDIFGSSKIKVKRAGRFRIDSMITFVSATTGVSIAVQVQVNGIPVPYGVGRHGVVSGGVNDKSSSSISIIADLLEDDEIEIVTFQNGAAGTATHVAQESNLLLSRFPQA